MRLKISFLKIDSSTKFDRAVLKVGAQRMAGLLLCGWGEL